MDNYIFPNKTDLVNYLFDKLDDPSPIKIQKTLYFLFAYYGATYGKLGSSTQSELEVSNYTKYLFTPNFEAWMYGPVDPEVYDKNRNSEYSAQTIKPDTLNSNLTNSEKQNIIMFANNIIRQTNEVDDFSLVERTHEDDAWRIPYEEGNGAYHIKMDPNTIIDEYCTKYV
ncbi:TPA: DUF4065 domain-containing protein [Streptococcus suis]|uniref:Panacea domain-containing protein n=1 Tax=Streptococcus suis TaxID=1307 RepID=UPI000462C308|nr:type II toxin-antitoxin system antitoxin SocA domain-containing protein [Streptococcus suis]HEL2473858.1 DUF4065 domain-containing protein [Streptococcus suis]HEM2751033.1 DUF4065 domain-containing protein [Streptococcus suis]HEM3181053.1 DUF4065 domain-containing protein [Streptococcus suis 89-5259]HEM4991039.1 DUF4065 domain-containing protein [Streptococcus suis]HEM5207896.1 DUF4065 domain-containing protein [Streptococcus suis]